MNEANVEHMLAKEKCEHDMKFFEPLGKVDEKTGQFGYDSSLTGVTEQRLSEIRGVYVKAEELKGGQTITMTFTVQTKENEPGDWYRNVSNSWIVGSKLPPLTSNRVQTVAVGRRISGVVWYDKNLNGIRDDKEKLLDDVEVTLFKKNAETESMKSARRPSIQTPPSARRRTRWRIRWIRRVEALTPLTGWRRAITSWLSQERS